MKKKETFLIKFAKNILRALKVRSVRLYGSKFSKRTYTLHQHIVLLSLREYFHGMGLRRFCELLPDFGQLLDFLELSQIPHFTTLHKMAKRLKSSLVEGVLLGFASKAKFRAGIDSTGLSLQHSTHYYEKRLEHFRKTKKKKPGRPKKRRKKKHQYTNLFADLDHQLFLSSILRRGSKSDFKMMIPTVNKARELFDQMVSNDADRGYDAEYNHEYVGTEMKSADFIKLRNEEVPVHKTEGVYRKKAKRLARSKKGRPRKNHRNKIEGMIFTLKKVFGEHLSATKCSFQRQQTRFRLIGYNAYRKASFVNIWDFYGTGKR